MIILHKHNLVYLAVPKTGSTSIETALDPFASSALRSPPGLKHANARRFEREIRPLFDRPNKRNLETIAVIRDPVDWLLSWYKYRGRASIAGSPNSTADISFEAFVDAYLSDDRPAFANVGAQSQFVSDAAGKVIVSHLFQYEKLPTLLEFLSERIGTYLVLPNLNQSPKSHVTVSKKTRSLLETNLEADFDLHTQLDTAPLRNIA